MRTPPPNLCEPGMSTGKTDPCAVLCAGVGIMLLPASIAFMVQGSCIMFTALCSRLFLKRPINRLHARGIALSTLGIVAVAVAGYIYSRENKEPPIPRPGPALRGAGFSAQGDAYVDVEDSLEALNSEADPARFYDRTPVAETKALTGVSSSRDWAAAAWWDRHAPQRMLLSPGHQIAAGVLFTLASQLAQALQFVSEEQLLCDSQLHPVQVCPPAGPIVCMVGITLWHVIARSHAISMCVGNGVPTAYMPRPFPRKTSALTYRRSWASRGCYPQFLRLRRHSSLQHSPAWTRTTAWRICQTRWRSCATVRTSSASASRSWRLWRVATCLGCVCRVRAAAQALNVRMIHRGTHTPHRRSRSRREGAVSAPGSPRTTRCAD